MATRLLAPRVAVSSVQLVWLINASRKAGLLIQNILRIVRHKKYTEIVGKTLQASVIYCTLIVGLLNAENVRYSTNAAYFSL
jgi:hypothetical protein